MNPRSPLFAPKISGLGWRNCGVTIPTCNLPIHVFLERAGRRVVLRSSDIHIIQLSPSERERCRHFAASAAVGGRSEVRGRADREHFLVTDQEVGQLGESALSKYIGGTLLFYELTRTIRDLDPQAGDGGGDLLATNLDVKCSVMRASPDPLRYRLLVRPRERHADSVYVLALVAPDVWQTGDVQLVGWCKDSDLPSQSARDGPFAGAYVVPATELHPLPPFTFNWQWNFRDLTIRPAG